MLTILSKVNLVGRATGETLAGLENWAIISITEPDPNKEIAELKYSMNSLNVIFSQQIRN